MSPVNVDSSSGRAPSVHITSPRHCKACLLCNASSRILKWQQIVLVPLLDFTRQSLFICKTVKSDCRFQNAGQQSQQERAPALTPSFADWAGLGVSQGLMLNAGPPSLPHRVLIQARAFAKHHAGRFAAVSSVDTLKRPRNMLCSAIKICFRSHREGLQTARRTDGIMPASDEGKMRQTLA